MADALPTWPLQTPWDSLSFRCFRDADSAEECLFPAYEAQLTLVWVQSASTRRLRVDYLEDQCLPSGRNLLTIGHGDPVDEGLGRRIVWNASVPCPRRG